MSSFEKFEAAVFHIRNIATHQFEFEPVAVMRRPKEHRLIHQPESFFPFVEYRFDDELGLRIAVLDRDVTRLFNARLRSNESFAVLPGALGDEAIGRVEDGLGRPVILFERDRFCRGLKLPREFEDIVDPGGAESINRLRIITHDGQACTRWYERVKNLRLQVIRILIFVDENVIEP